MYYINHIDSFSIHSNVCAQKSVKRTCQGFDPVTPLYFFFFFLHADKAMKHTTETVLFFAINNARLTDSITC